MGNIFWDFKEKLDKIRVPSVQQLLIISTWEQNEWKLALITEGEYRLDTYTIN